VYSSETGKTEPVFIPKGATNIQLKDVIFRVQGERMTSLENKVAIMFTVCRGDGPSSFTTPHGVATSKMRTTSKSRVVLVMPRFTLFVTGDLAFYADSLGKMK
jgi:hypothetical protein